ncbi:Permease of the drug/metabolite transporter (DMT) superfamily [Ruegeria halocynthiae]|uniref:Permease of the drug/metabolite transporter (DMT) superfamily n=1 Tax=Ruegeria halocynthiae TaxID=985054 RepID=A0A1H2TXL7_9RHOB|nr:DMT family transporter [Ruegeria halocynthiae]SDW48487.1 Permease of the drug/metabolite transporter (DMT) superfamily [Ruegeria halocynthiae]
MTSQKTLTPRTWYELILLGVIWGMSFLAIRIALDTIPVITSVFHRVFWAALVLWIVIAFQRLPIPRSPRIWAIFLIMGLLNNVLPFSLMAWGQLYVETGLTSILNAATAIFGVLLAALFFRDERLTKTRILGVGLGFLGVSITIGLRQFGNLNPDNLGQIAILAGTLSYAFAAIWARIYMGDLSPKVAAAGMLTGSAILMTPIMLVTDGIPTLALPLETWLAIAYYALLATAGAYLLYYRVLQQAGSGNVLLVTLIIPPIAILMGAIVRNEALPARAFVGFAVLAVGLLILSRSRRRD